MDSGIIERNFYAGYGLAVTSGLLLLLSFPPLNLEFLAWVALVPILVAMYYEKSEKRIGKLVTVFGLCLFPIFMWLYSEFEMLGLPTPLSLLIGVFCGVFLGQFYIAFHGYWRGKHSPSKGLAYLPSSLQIIIPPIIWTSLEFIVMSVPWIMKVGGFVGYVTIAHTQFLNVPILQLASFTGVLGITFLIILVNCAIAYAIVHYREKRGVYKPAIVVLFLFSLIFSYGWLSVPEPVEGEVEVVVIQGLVTGRGEFYLAMSQESLKYNPKVVIWPITVDVTQHQNFTEEHNVYLMSTSLVTPTGEIYQHTMTYHFVNILDGILPPFDLERAFFPKIQGFDTAYGKFGLELMCQESGPTFPARQLVMGGTQFITTSSGNWGWGFGFPGFIQGNIIFRAVENHVPAALAQWCGGSIIVDQYGRIIKDEATEPEIVTGKISLTNKTTLYTKYGDVFGWTVVGLALILFGYNFYLKRKSPFMYCEHCQAQIAKGVEICPECGKKPKKTRWEKSDIRKLWKLIARK